MIPVVAVVALVVGSWIIRPLSAFTPSSYTCFRQSHVQAFPVASDILGDDLDTRLYEIAKRLKLEVFDLDEGIYGYDSKDSRFGIEVIKTCMQTKGGLGLVLTEMAGSNDGRGLVLISDVSGNAAMADPKIQVGDIITGIIAGDFRERTTELNYDRLVEVIGRAKDASSDGTLMLELDRLVERAVVTVEVEDTTTGETQTIHARAGENLRRLLLRKGIKLYDYQTKRFDMPFSQGDCAGEGMCGTCLVDVKEGSENLNPQDGLEEMITKGRPARWRASCRAIIGPDNKPGHLRISTMPQSASKDELNPGVRSVN